MSTKDMMPHFELYQPTDVAHASSLLARYGHTGWAMAGGQDSLDWFKDRAKRPVAVVDLKSIPDLDAIREREDGGLEIGALATLRQIAESPLVQARFGLLAEAANRVASPQIRNTATLGGNLCQDARCWYYRAGLDCYRAGGNTCYADTPAGMNREHCLFGASRCVAVTPSDTAPAMVALDAVLVVQNGDNVREIPAQDFFIGPDVDITRMTVLQAGDVLTHVRLPGAWAGARFYFEKVADRATWDFALVNVAAALRMNGDTVEDARVVCGGVQCVPRRLNVVEDVMRGSQRDQETIDLAASAASRGATPLNYNHFKVPLMENLVRRALRDS